MRQISLAVLAAAILAACSQPTPLPETPTPETPANAALQALDDYRWTLSDARSAGGQPITALIDKPGTPLVLQFDAEAGRVGLLNGCNQMGAAVTSKGAGLEVGNITSTLMACADDRLMRFDAAAANALRGQQTWSLREMDPPTLTLTNAAGDVLVFAGETTPETRYGGPGETVFLEVAAQTQPCSHPLMPNMQCLQVRELQYDAQGLRRGTAGEFQHFYDRIQGYEHQPGVRNVLRVKRYKVPNPPADASNLAWVLDMVVESETVKP